ncbi:hypothetical protein VNO78_19435 [Psophocarpus tetragonolobus]|uniref:Uncharacterized protein n=1 Tax=Psophocarpus tetragonolobus TaxID=3891 RepID=A0AAN9SBH0_PSOTE
MSHFPNRQYETFPVCGIYVAGTYQIEQKQLAKAAFETSLQFPISSSSFRAVVLVPVFSSIYHHAALPVEAASMILTSHTCCGKIRSCGSFT